MQEDAQQILAQKDQDMIPTGWGIYPIRPLFAVLRIVSHFTWMLVCFIASAAMLYLSLFAAADHQDANFVSWLAMVPLIIGTVLSIVVLRDLILYWPWGNAVIILTPTALVRRRGPRIEYYDLKSIDGLTLTYVTNGYTWPHHRISFFYPGKNNNKVYIEFLRGRLFGQTQSLFNNLQRYIGSSC